MIQQSSSQYPLDLWISETHQGMVSLSFRTMRTLFSGRSAFQKVDIVETAGHGRMLINDGIIMLSERDEFIYHEMIAHVPLFVHPDPQNVLIIGGGDGGTAREVLKHRNVKRVVLVEIDALVVEACKAHLPELTTGLDDPRLELIIGDGVRYVTETEETFDVVLVDSSDPIGPAVALFDRPFYQDVASLLNPNGIMVSQAESPFYDTDLQRTMLGNQRPFFERLHIYLFNTLTYPGGLWSFGFASKGPCPFSDFRPAECSKLQNRYYNPEIHRAAFMLPTFLQKKLEGIIDSTRTYNSDND